MSTLTNIFFYLNISLRDGAIHPNLYIKPTDGQQYLLKPITPFPTCQNVNTIQLIIMQIRVSRIICQERTLNSYLSDKGAVLAKG